MSRLVICHVADDASLARELAHELQGAGFEVGMEVPDDGLAPPTVATGEANRPAAAVLVIISAASLLNREVDQVVEQIIATSQTWEPLLNGVSDWELGLRRPAWVAALGQRRLLTLRHGQVAATLPRLLDHLDDLGVATDGQRPRRAAAPPPIAPTSSFLPPPLTTSLPGPSILPPLPPSLMLSSTPPPLQAAWLTLTPIDTSALATPPPLADAAGLSRPLAEAATEPVHVSPPTVSDDYPAPPSATRSAETSARVFMSQPAGEDRDEPGTSSAPPADAAALAALPPRERLQAIRAARAVEAPPPKSPRARAKVTPAGQPTDAATPKATSKARDQQRRRGCIGCLTSSGIGLGLIAVAIAALVFFASTDRSGSRREAATAGVASVATSEATAELAATAPPSVSPTSAATRAATRTPAPTRTPGATATTATAPTTAALADTFDAPESGLLPRESTSPEEYRRGYDQGEYVIAVVDPDWDLLPVAHVEESFANATLAVEARLIGETAERYIALACRDQAESSGSQYRLVVNPGQGRFKLSRQDGGREVTLTNWQSSRVIRQGNQTNRIQLRCVGATISADINGTTVTSVRDATYMAGQFWIGAATFTGKSGTVEARFDNLTIARQ